MKRRTFIQTILGALAAVGCGAKLFDNEVIYLYPYRGEKRGQMLFVSDPQHGRTEWVDLNSYRLVYQAGLLKNIGPYSRPTVTAWSGKNWLKIPIEWLA